MPTYEYVCTKCDHPFEVVQSMKDKPLTTCPKESCGMKKWGKGKVRRAIGAGAGLIFKGSGFYITDYRSENYKAGAKKDSSTSALTTSSTSSEGKSSVGESKSTPTKSETKPKPAKT